MLSKNMRRALVFVSCLALVAGLAATAVAKPTSKHVVVTMTYGEAGIATTCNDGGALEMTGFGRRTLRADFGPETALEMALPIPWSRNHPDSSEGVRLEGCHGPAVPFSGPGFEGYFIIDQGPEGSVHMTSRFDYYWEYETVQQGKRQKTVQTVLEFFEINGDLVRKDGLDFDWNLEDVPQTVRGDVELLRFEKTSDEGSLWTSYGNGEVGMTITINRG
jgi:hypothetical protein